MRAVLVVVIAIVGCGDDASMGADGGADAGADAALPDPVCGPGTAHAPGMVAFREATAEWGLTGVEGTRLNVGDVDGDGRADVLVRRGPQGSDDLAGGSMRFTWLLRNTGAGFEDVTVSSGILAKRSDASGAVGRPVIVAAFADVDDDGDLDAYLGTDTTNDESAAGETSEVMLNDGSGHFALGPDSEVRSVDRFDVPAGASFVDADRDGNVDLWVVQHNFTDGSDRTIFMPDRLYRGDGSGAFAEITDAAGLTTRGWTDITVLNEARAHTRAWAAAACDLNGDGTTELLSASYGRAPNHLWQGSRMEDGSVLFTNRSVASGYAYDGDMTWQDNQYARCFCMANPTAVDCAGLPAPTIVCMPNWNHDTDREPFRLGGNSGATSCADVDNDGDLDLMTSEIRHWWAGAGADGSELLVNSGEMDVRFERPGDDATGLGTDHLGRADWDEGHMTNAVLDFDNDGWPDIYIGASDYPGNRGSLYRQVAPRSFVELAVNDFFEHNRSHGVAVADFDRDGDLDLLVGHSRARCAPTLPNDCYTTGQVRLFLNEMGGNFLSLVLTGGAEANRGAIGARVQVTAGGVTQTQEVGGGYGHYGAQHDMALHFGLGAACEAEVTVRWPDAALTEERFTLPAGHRFRITQGAGARVVL